jgi:ABC-2 type transport system ATP-binding protein
VGVCPQEVILWEKLTCLEQLEFIGELYGVPRRLSQQRGEELLDILGLTEKRNQLASKLSGGMQRRLNLALALIHDPEILVLDEPEAGLDPQSRVLVREYIRSLAGEKTIILTTHNMDEADRMADRIAILDHGQLLVLDTPEALKGSIGDGDVLELTIQGISSAEALSAIQAISTHIKAVEIANSQGSQSLLPGERTTDPAAGMDSAREKGDDRTELLSLRGPSIGEKLPALMKAVQQSGGQVGEVHLRPNTLEDVFISLTGRRLRE